MSTGTASPPSWRQPLQETREAWKRGRKHGFLQGVAAMLVVLVIGLVGWHGVQLVRLHDDYVDGQQFRARMFLNEGRQVVSRYALLTICAKEAHTRYDAPLDRGRAKLWFEAGCSGDPEPEPASD